MNNRLQDDNLTCKDIREIVEELNEHTIKGDLIMPVNNPVYLEAIEQLIEQGTLTYTNKGQYRVLNDPIPDGRKLADVLMDVTYE